MRLAPFWCFYGGKWRDAPNYPAPLYTRIFEPFAGAAGYSLRHHTLDVVLVEADPQIAALWRWLISATQDDVLGLPLDVPTIVDDLGLAPGPAALVGFWVSKGVSTPRQSPSRWMRDGTRPHSFWGRTVRERIAAQVGAITHWTVIEGDYTETPNEEATHFVDPPYERAGVHYRKRFAGHAALGEWCQARHGQVIVCENDGATWLPFRPHRVVKANESRTGGKVSREVVWLGGRQPPVQIAVNR